MKTIILFTLFSLIILSCNKKEIKPHLGTYSIEGSILGPPVPEPSPISYSITFGNSTNGKIKIENLSDNNAKLKAAVDGKTFTVVSDEFITNDDNLKNYSNISGSRVFYDDSLSYEVSFSNALGETFWINSVGVKI